MRRQKTSSTISATLATLVLLAIAAFSSPGFAQVKPGEFITPENASVVKDLVGPGVFLQGRARHDHEDRADRARRLAAAL